MYIRGKEVQLQGPAGKRRDAQEKMDVGYYG